MSVSQFIPSYDDVRGVLGLSSDELEDSQIELRVFELSLIDALEEIKATLVDDYLAIDLQAIPANDQDMVDAVQVFSVFHVAHDRMPTLELTAPRLISDGKATVQRQSLIDMAYVRDSVVKRLAKARADLLEVLGLTVTETVSGSNGLLLRSRSTIDPVTGAASL